jgi:nitrite reductase (cytochrome c-552)
MKRSLALFIVIGLMVILAAALVYQRGEAGMTRGGPPTDIADMEPDSAVWGTYFPNQYATLLQTELNNTRTEYGGSYPFSHLEDDPRLLTLFAGYGFSIEYNDDRGHWNALTDVREIDRVTATTPGTCYSCKSSNNPSLWDEMGMAAYDATLFSDLGVSIDHPIGCANCHDATTMRLIVTNPAFEAALQAQGLDWRTFTRQEMRTAVCGNCHVEYYFAGTGKYLTFPWANGRNIDDIATYYKEIGFTDWTHPESGTAMIKMQHPEFETYTNNSVHYLAGVACADCHMPYVTGGAMKYSTHDVKSPLLDPEPACGACHKDVERVVERVGIIQDRVNATLLATEDALVDCINAIEAATLSGGDPTLLAEARNLHREAQLRWDFVAAENSMGFHNPDEALRVLAKATNLARQAQITAIQAMP